LSICVLVKARTQLVCPLSSGASSFKVLCSIDNPCQDVDIYCPADSNTKELWVDCNGAHACVNVNIYSSVNSQIRCRGRTGACQSMNIYCGSVASMVESLNVGLSFSDNNNPVSCQFRHMDSRVTLDTFFGCYGDVDECNSAANGDNAYTDSTMFCATTNGIPCLMKCQTETSCMNNEMECQSADSSLCQCQPDTNCANVLFVDPQDLVTTTSLNTETPTTTASSNTGIPVITTSPNTGVPVITTSSNTGIPVITTSSNTETPATTTQVAQSALPQTTETAVSTTSVITNKPATPSPTVGTLPHTPETSMPTPSKIAAADSNATVKSTNDTLKSWQLILIIILLLIAVIACFAGGYILKRWKACGAPKQAQDEENQWGVFAPPKDTVPMIETKTEVNGESPNATVTLTTTPSAVEPEAQPETQPVTDLKTETIPDGENQDQSILIRSIV